MQLDEEPGGGLRLTPRRQGVALAVAVIGAILLAVSRLPADRTLAFAASTTLVGLFLLVGAAVAGTAARTASVVRRVRSRGFVGTQPAEGSYREVPRRGMVIVDGEPLEGPFRVEPRLDRPSRGPGVHKIFLVGARQLLVVGEVAGADEARALVRRVESALGLPLTQPDVDRPFRFDEEPPAALWMMLGFTAGYLALAFALSHWLFAEAELVARREPLAPLILVPFGAIAYGAWSTVGAAAARARLRSEFDLRR